MNGPPPVKTHHVGGCWLGRSLSQGPRRTLEVGEVTCQNCRHLIHRHKVRSRSEFPDTPTFTVDERRSFTCQVCRKLNTHGAGDGHRLSHCNCWEPRGYFIARLTPQEGPSRQMNGFRKKCEQALNTTEVNDENSTRNNRNF